VDDALIPHPGDRFEEVKGDGPPATARAIPVVSRASAGMERLRSGFRIRAQSIYIGPIHASLPAEWGE